VINIDEWLLMDGPEGLGPVANGLAFRPGTGARAERIQTSSIVRIRFGARVIVTRSGSTYRLRSPSVAYLDWVRTTAGAHHLRFVGLWERGPAEVVCLNAWKEMRK